MQKIFFFFLSLFFASSLIAQNSQSDKEENTIADLLKTYKKTKDTLQIQKALGLAYETNNDSIIRETNIVYGLQSYFKNDLNNLKKSSFNLLKIYQKNNDSLSLAKHYHYKALFFMKKYATDSCFYYYHKSKNISLLLNDSLSVGRRLLSMARVQQREKDYLGSEVTTVEALRFLEPLNENKYTSYCYNNMGLILSNTGRYEEARKNYQKSFELGYQKSTKKSLTTYVDYFNNKAITFLREGKYKKSIEILTKIVDDSIKIKRPLRYYNAIDNIGYNYFKLGKYKAALDNYNIGLRYNQETNNERRLSISYSILAELYLFQKKYSTSKKYALEALKYAKRTNNSERILENYFYLSELEKGEKSKDYLRKYISLNESLLDKERNLTNKFARVRYETEKKDIENTTLKAENDKKQLQIEKEQQQKLIGWLFAGVSLLFIAFGLVIISNRRKKIEYESKLKQVEIREKERQQIAKSLHDEVAGDIRMLHKKLVQNKLIEESKELDKVNENVRTLSHQLSSVSFDEVTFKNQIINLVSDYFDADFRIKIREINTVEWNKINSSIKRTLFLTIRESIQNIDKHAKAKTVQLQFEDQKKTIKILIKDDGKGFNLKLKKRGIGLKNMKERVEEINGVFTLESELEKGTQITIIIPKNGR